MIRSHEQRKEERTLGEKLMRLGAFSSLVLTLAGVAKPTMEAQAYGSEARTVATQPANPNVNRSLESSVALIPIEKLPGYGKNVTKDQIALRRDSTVKIVEVDTYKDGSQDFIEIGTGQKISINGKIHVEGSLHTLSAMHGYDTLTGAPSGIINSGVNGPEAGDILPALQEIARNKDHIGISYIIADPKRPISVRDKAPLAEVTKIAASFRSHDKILITAEPVQLTETGQAAGTSKTRTWAQVPAIPYKKEANPPLPGSGGINAGVPAPFGENAGSEVTNKGIFIGQKHFKYSGIGDRLLNVFVTNPATAGEAACGYGGSGGGATTYDGHELGTLWASINVGFGSKHLNRLNPDKITLKQAMDAWKFVETRTGVRIPMDRYNTICLYEPDDKNTVTSLVDGTGVKISATEFMAMARL